MDDPPESEKIPDTDLERGFEFTFEQANEIVDKIFEKAKTRKCEWCGEEDWRFSQTVITDTLFDVREDIHRHDRVSLVAAIRCHNCANQKYFNLSFLGYTPQGGFSKNK